MEITIEKSTAENYKLRGTNGSFANITLDYSGKQGRVSISTDYGNWSYYWGACGSQFKEFLIGLDKDYAAGKFGEDRHFDHDATIKYLSGRIKECANNKHHKSELKRQLEDLKNCPDLEEFIATIRDCEDIFHMEDCQPDLIRSVSPGFTYFWENLWKAFVDSLKEEIEMMLPV